MSGIVSIKTGDETDLQAAVASVGPVSVAVDGRNTAFRVCRKNIDHSAGAIIYVAVYSHSALQLPYYTVLFIWCI